MSDYHNLFISYSTDDTEIVSGIVEKISSFDVQCWFQQKDSKQSFFDAVADGIDNSTSFIVFLSDTSVNSLYVKNEIICGINKFNENPDYKILPVVLTDTDETSSAFKGVSVLLAAFNRLYVDDYCSSDELVLKIFDQLNIQVSSSEGRQSLYHGNSSVEAERIRIQTELYNLYAQKYIDEIFNKMPNPVVLDIGCSDAKTIMSRINDKPYTLLVGVDKNDSKISEANKAFPDKKNIFVNMDITADSLYSSIKQVIEENGFHGADVIHISSVLLHISEPQKLLASLHKILKPGGFIFIQEEDDGLNKVFPDSPYFKNCFFIYDHCLESGDRRMGRKIPVLLKNAGFHNINLRSSVITSLDFEKKYQEALWDFYFNPNLWESIESAKFFDNKKAFDLVPSIFSAHDTIKKEFLDGKYFIIMGIMFFVAKK